MSNISQASASTQAQEHAQIMNLSHNQLQVIFDSLSFNEIINMRVLSKQMNEQIKLYLNNIYIPRHFQGFNLEEEKTTIEQLQKRQLTLNCSTILSQEGIKSLQNLFNSHSELVQNITACYNILEDGLFSYDKGTNQQVFNSEKFASFASGFDMNKISAETFELLAEQVQKISMAVVTPQMRHVALMARTFSQLVMNFQFQTKLKSTKLRVGQYQVIQNIISEKARV